MSVSSLWLLPEIASFLGVWQNKGVCCPEDFDMVTLADALEVVEQLAEEDLEMLVDIVRNRQIERRRDEIARDAQATLAEYREGKLKSMTAEEAIALLRADLDSSDEL